MRERIYEIIGEVTDEDSDKLSHYYDMVMVVVIIASLIPMMFKKTNFGFEVMTWIATAIFIADYILRWITADLKLRKGPRSFLLYPFTPMAVVDLLSILPTFYLLAAGFRTLRVLRLIRALRVVRMLKFAVGYVLLCALVMFNVEPDTFDNFFEALYWATVSLTTMGYGDIAPTSDVGRVVTMMSSFIGIAVVALPAGIITAGYTHEIQEMYDREDDENGLDD